MQSPFWKVKIASTISGLLELVVVASIPSKIRQYSVSRTIFETDQHASQNLENLRRDKKT
jgi:hypothetical protein